MMIAIHRNSIRTALALLDTPKTQADIDMNARALVSAISGMLHSSDRALSDEIASCIGLPSIEEAMTAQVQA